MTCSRGYLGGRLLIAHETGAVQAAMEMQSLMPRARSPFDH
jgi:hypothetical protein